LLHHTGMVIPLDYDKNHASGSWNESLHVLQQCPENTVWHTKRFTLDFALDW
jgi:hypothetical protein